MHYLITGCAGFIGYHLCKKILEKNKVVKLYGVDNINDYYDINIKLDRLKDLRKYKNFEFKKIDIKNYEKLNNYLKSKKISYVINLASQAGVRYSIKNPRAYLESNIIGFFNLIEISNQTHRFVENKCQQEYSNLVDQQYCINTSLVAQDVADFIIKLRQTRRGRREKTPKIEHRDKTIVHSLKEDHPKAQCRLDTMFEGALCNKDYSWSMHNCPFTKQFYRGSRPQCWYYPAKN